MRLLRCFCVANFLARDSILGSFFIFLIFQQLLSPIQPSIIPEKKEDRKTVTLIELKVINQKTNFSAGHFKPKKPDQKFGSH
jgi:hypothetical protein